MAKIKKAGLEREWQLVQSAPGLKETSAANVLAEIGPDMSQFPSVRQISSWGGVCPGNNRSAGKNKNSHTTGGNPWLRAALTECAWAAAAKKECFLKEKFWRITTKSGGKKAPAIVAVAHHGAELCTKRSQTGAISGKRKVADLNPGKRDRMIRYHVKRLGKLGVVKCVRVGSSESQRPCKTKNAKRTSAEEKLTHNQKFTVRRGVIFGRTYRPRPLSPDIHLCPCAATFGLREFEDHDE